MQPKSAPECGRRLMPTVLDEFANRNPDKVFAAIPKTSDIKDGYRDVTVADMARCVHFMARWLEDKFGRSNNFETITYIGPSDFRGPAIVLGAVKAGYKTLVPSPRNPPSTNLSLMNQTGSTKLLYAAELAPLIKPLQALDGSIRSDVVPSFQEMLESNPKPYPYEKTFEEAINDPMIILHSSGSTGMPKPITCTHGSWAAHDNDHNLPAPAGREKMDSTVFDLDGETRLYVMLPFFHLGGCTFFLYHTIFNGITLVIGPPHVAPDAPLIKEIAEQQKLRGIMAIPALVEQLLHDPTGIDLIMRLEFLVCGGADLPAAVGNQLKDVVKLYNFIGSTETFPLPELSKSQDDWMYHEFNPNFKHKMEPYDPEQGTFELVVIVDESTKDSSPVYHNVPGISPYYTKDLFTQHPEKPNLFRYYGRRDDILVLTNGEKVNPIPLEQKVQGHPSVRGAIVVGTGRIQTALLIEPREPLEGVSRDEFLEALWPHIQESNTAIPGQGRIARDKVICALPDKPFHRTAKGTIVRKLTEEAYKDEIEELYSSSTAQSRIAMVDLKANPDGVYESAEVIDFLRQVISISFPPVTTIEENEDFFAHGLDSLQTLEITANLKRSLEGKSSTPITWISPRTIFRNSSLVELSKLICKFLNEGRTPEKDSQADHSYAVDEAVARYVEDLPGKPAPRVVPSTDTSTVAIIGSTGYLGTHLVATLLRNPKVERIYCLNRGSDAQKRQAEALDNLDHTLAPLLHKLSYMKVKLGEPLLGLGNDQYNLIAEKVDVIVYNSWRLDFGLAIRSFDPFLRASRDLVELSVNSKRNMRIVFVSSMSSVEGLAVTGTAPETAVEDGLAALTTGYGQSKLAAERILVAGNRKSGVPVSIARIGQVGGPSLGTPDVWADQPWISAIIRTSKRLGYFPNPVAAIDWVPVNIVANMLQRFILRPAKEESQVYNVVSDKPQAWDLLFEVVRESGAALEAISFRDWVSKLRNISDPSPQEVADMPALKMLDFYETLGSGAEQLRYATSHAREVSGVEIPAIDKTLLISWLRDWNL
ncbi:acetyl-CoA synthetase-like protein [Hypomontagnella monticulosa]|nr:acetyl-CoA synthetase-like protein [Hypomontagnella monticulosa]